jgi:hypothetical protein
MGVKRAVPIADRRDMSLKDQLRLRLVLPLAAVAVTGVAATQIGVLDKLAGSDHDAAAASAAQTQPVAPESEPAEAKPAESPAAEPAVAPAAKPRKSGPERLGAQLEKHGVVVVVVYSPDSAVDALAIAEARSGAKAAGAGFLALSAAKEKEIGELAQSHNLRLTPTTLVFADDSQLVKKFAGFVDRQTVAQAAQDARPPA